MMIPKLETGINQTNCPEGVFGLQERHEMVKFLMKDELYLFEV
jgi:hypothetical protein